MYPLTQDKDILVGTLCVAHLQGHKGDVTVFCPQFGLQVWPRIYHAYLAGTLCWPPTEDWWLSAQWVAGYGYRATHMPSCMINHGAWLARTLVSAHLEPNDTATCLHKGGVIKVPLLLLWIFNSDVHATLQILFQGLHCQSKKTHLHPWSYSNSQTGHWPQKRSTGSEP